MDSHQSTPSTTPSNIQFDVDIEQKSRDGVPSENGKPIFNKTIKSVDENNKTKTEIRLRQLNDIGVEGTLLINIVARFMLTHYLRKNHEHFFREYSDTPLNTFFVKYEVKDDLSRKTYLMDKYFNEKLSVYNISGEVLRDGTNLYFHYDSKSLRKFNNVTEGSNFCKLYMPVDIFKTRAGTTVAILLLPLFVRFVIDGKQV